MSQKERVILRIEHAKEYGYDKLFVTFWMLEEDGRTRSFSHDLEHIQFYAYLPSSSSPYTDSYLRMETRSYNFDFCQMETTLKAMKAIRRKMEKQAEQFGYPRDLEQAILHLASAVKAEQCTLAGGRLLNDYDRSDNLYELKTGASRVRRLRDALEREYAPAPQD